MNFIPSVRVKLIFLSSRVFFGNILFTHLSDKVTFFFNPKNKYSFLGLKYISLENFPGSTVRWYQKSKYLGVSCQFHISQKHVTSRPISKILFWKEILYPGYFYFLCSAIINFQAALLRIWFFFSLFMLLLFSYLVWYILTALIFILINWLELSRALYKDVLKLAGEQGLP